MNGVSMLGQLEARNRLEKEPDTAAERSKCDLVCLCGMGLTILGPLHFLKPSFNKLVGS